MVIDVTSVAKYNMVLKWHWNREQNSMLRDLSVLHGQVYVREKIKPKIGGFVATLT